jgi:transposase
MVAARCLRWPRELNLHENLLAKWVRAERLRDGVVTDVRHAPPDGELTASERAELVRLRAEVAEKDRDITFLKRVSAYFAARQHR